MKSNSEPPGSGHWKKKVHTPSRMHAKKVLNLSFLACHCKNGAWSNTILPVVLVLCHEESIWTLESATEALISVVRAKLSVNLADWVGDWYWDGAAEAQNVFSRYFPPARGHTCLEHAKRNACRRAQGGLGKQMKLRA